MEDPQNCTEISTNAISITAKEVQSVSSLCEQQRKTYDIETAVFLHRSAPEQHTEISIMPIKSCRDFTVEIVNNYSCHTVETCQMFAASTRPNY